MNSNITAYLTWTDDVVEVEGYESSNGYLTVTRGERGFWGTYRKEHWHHTRDEAVVCIRARLTKRIGELAAELDRVTKKLEGLR